MKMKRAIDLDFIDILRKRLSASNDLIQVVLGPRQVGKTTTILKLIEESYPNNSHYVSADSIFNSDANWLTEQWLIASANQQTLFVDEIQKIYNWAETVKALYDQDKREGKPVKCVLLGSSSLKIQQGLTESLTGRFQQVNVYHWNFHESEKGYGLSFADYMKFGGYPGSYQLSEGDWIDYIQNSVINTVVERDILQHNVVRKPSLFKQVFELAISYPAQEISYTKLLGQLQDKGNVEIVKYYLSLYEGAFLIKALEKFSSKPVKVKSSSPKILPLAPCLPYLRIRGEYTEEEQGRILEVIVGAQLVRTQEELYYWREKDYEVDYVVRVGRELYAIEVKSNRKKTARGLKRFKDKFPDSHLVIINQENYKTFELDPLAFLRATKN